MYRYLFVFMLLEASTGFAQEVEMFSARSENMIAEALSSEIQPEHEENDLITIVIEDIDDVSAHLALSDNVELFAGATNALNIDMQIDRYDEDQLIDLSPMPIDDIYPVDGSSRSILAGIQLTF